MESLQVQLPRPGHLLVKGAITGFLILVLMIPTIIIRELVEERQKRQQEVTLEVGGKWSAPQTVSGPMLFIPYTYPARNEDGKSVLVRSHFWILPEQLSVTGAADHELRKRSIYQVLLYRSRLSMQGQFHIRIPEDVDSASILWKDARICIGISDFKGIEERMILDLGGRPLELAPGLPNEELIPKGLSASLSSYQLPMNGNINFSTNMRIKGSGQLHFLPLAGNSSFQLSSSWPAPSFDGNNLPTERNVTKSGFTALWSFNKANLPFSTILHNNKLDVQPLAFGVSLMQPADQYAKTERSAKYAILVIGLTLSLFFIIEILQKKPLHPVQYVLIGLALVIFYTLLLSIGEFLVFNLAYAIAASATIMLISLYVHAHFRNWKTTFLFGGVLSLLYLFIFILVQLEDTALLVGSIGLFLILALAMYASRSVNWYPEKM